MSLHILVSYLFYQQAISRVDSRPKLERYLKRFCRRLICCEFFLSLKPVPTPCPDRCQADGGKELLVLDVVKKIHICDGQKKRRLSTKILLSVMLWNRLNEKEYYLNSQKIRYLVFISSLWSVNFEVCARLRMLILSVNVLVI